MAATLILRGLPPGWPGQQPGVPGPLIAHLFDRGQPLKFRPTGCLHTSLQAESSALPGDETCGRQHAMNPPISDIRIDIEGTWSYRGMEMTRRDIIRLFYRHLKCDESGGYFIEIGRQRCRVDVEDTAYVVWAVRWTDEEAKTAGESAWLLLSDDSLERLDPETLRVGSDGVPHCRVKSGAFTARFSRSGYYQLAERIQYDPERDSYFILHKGKPVHIAMNACEAFR